MLLNGVPYLPDRGVCQLLKLPQLLPTVTTTARGATRRRAAALRRSCQTSTMASIGNRISANQRKLDDDGVAPGINANKVSEINVMDPAYLATVDTAAFDIAEQRTVGAACPSSAATAPLIDAQFEPRELYRAAVRHTDAQEYTDAAWRFLMALLMDWALNASDMSRLETAAAGLPATDACGIVLRALGKMFGKNAPEKWQDFEAARQPFMTAISELQALGPEVVPPPSVPQQPLPTTFEEQDRGRFALCCARIFLGRGPKPFTPSAWAAAREQYLVKGIASLDGERFLALQYELAYSARDVGDNREALVWYDKLLANIQRAQQPSLHWRTFRARVHEEARQLRFEQAFYHGRSKYAL